MAWSHDRSRWDDARGALWFKPALAVAVALVAGAVLSRIHPPLDSLVGRLTFRGDADDARQLLTAVTGTMITVTSLVFVLTVVALQIASTQFSPRLIRTFLRDGGTQVVLSTFVATVAYSLAGLYTVGGVTATGERFVPRLAVSGALLLALVSVGMLIYYIHHFTDGIRITTIMRRIEQQTLRLIVALPHYAPPGSPLPAAGHVAAGQLTVPDDAVAVPAPRSGYVQRFTLDRVHALAVRDDLCVRYAVTPGHRVVHGRPIAWVWGPGAVGGVDAATVVAGVHIAGERRLEQDLGFALRQLIDIALRAVAPSRNDPYTAVQALHHLTVLFSEAARRRLDADVRSDRSGQPRVVAPAMSFEMHLRVVCDHMRWSAAAQPRVLLALLRMLRTVGASATDPRAGAAVVAQIVVVLDDAERTIAQPADLHRIRAAATAARAACTTAGATAAGMAG